MIDHVANMVHEAAQALIKEIRDNGPTEKADLLWQTMLSGWMLRRYPDMPIAKACRLASFFVPHENGPKIFTGVDLASRPDESSTVLMCNCPKFPHLHPVHEDNPYEEKKS